MVSAADNPNFLFLEGFIKWAQEVYQNSCGLRISKRHTTVGKSGSYVTLTNIGKKKTDDPVTVFMRIKKIGIQMVSFEIYDTIVKKYIYFETDDVNFNFDHRFIDEKTVEDVSNYQESPYDHDFIPDDIAQSGASSASSPLTGSARSSPLPTRSASPSMNGDRASSSSNSSNGSTKLVQKEIISVEEESENELLKRELEKTTCEILILNIEKEALMRKLLHPEQEQDKQNFNIMNFKVLKPLSVTSGGLRLFAVEHVYKRTNHTLKEVIFDRFSPQDYKLNFKTELDTLNQLSTIEEKSPNLLYLVERNQDLTPVRQSHYFLYEPAVMGLEEFSFNFIKKNKNSIPIVISQILKGVSFLNTKAFRVHGNINIHSIVLDSNWNVKLTNFQYSLPISSTIDPRRILTGKLDYLSKHPSIFENLERQQMLIINQSIDRWALGCLFYKLLYEGELFLNSTNYRSHPALISTLTTLPHGRILFAFFDDYNRIVTADQMLASEFFSRYKDINLRSLFDGSHPLQSSVVPQQPQPQQQQQDGSNGTAQGTPNGTPPVQAQQIPQGPAQVPYPQNSTQIPQQVPNQ
ncbi:hypothetical protein BN7_2919 [Wickerhamomyces ciferrii]|uniref:Protein kinase domain-containing protein n=1 Tax=Wickerhamomyces ciferrii (strain ATCC 14091 / BCRC 22168 / CBS 111 / JCM 3599 / NBRC 0793 / NRRL Y-1031 F-60-10) TaxID=1206466 RepID=K0KKA1_WICCF|nr:uncharacterized protein BN7_2919 [Wickerhamomyces ciferrii]CCH43371.1 hypothetical protein BN7_2919 [Wickerhamomyces ciferrii]